MSFSTTYDVRVKYAVESRGAGQATTGLRDATRQLGSEAKRTSGELGKMAVAVVGAFGAQRAGAALIGFNSTVQDTQLQIAGMLALSKKTDLVDQVGRADKLYESLQRRAATLPGTTMEYARMAGMLTQPITAAGLGLKDLEDLTVNSVVGAKALGVEWQAAARDVDQALRGQFHSTDVFTGKILGSMGYEGEEGRAKFNALSATKRAEALKGALMQRQLTQLASAQGATFGGVVSTLQDTIEKTLGKVGLPLFKTITAEVKAWNSWLDKNDRKVSEMAKTIGEHIVTGFRYIKGVAEFLVGHADTFIAIGKIWLATKVGGMMTAAISGGKNGVGAFGDLRAWSRREGDRFNPETGAYEVTKAGAGRQRVGIGNIAGSLPLLAQSAAVGYAFGSIINEATGLSHALATLALDRTSKQFEQVNKAADALTASLQRAADANPDQAAAMTNLTGSIDNYRLMANIAADVARAPMSRDREGNEFAGDAARAKMRALQEMGVGADDISRAGGIKAYADAMAAKAQQLEQQKAQLIATGADAWEMGLMSLTEYQRQTLDSAKAQQDLLAYINNSIAKGIPIAPKTITEILRADTDDPQGKHKAMNEKPKVNVHIARIEVQSDDPDRMAFGLIEAFRDAAKNPSSAFASLREG